MQIDNCKLQIGDRREVRRGITLVELLVAISILVIVMAIGSRVLLSSADDRRTREAARQVNVYFASARNRAMETGRPCGVMIRRMEGRPQCAAVLDQVEVPPPYAGETLEATAQLQITDISGGLATLNAQLTPGINTNLVSQGDLVQFNHQGLMYEIVQPPTLTSLTLQIDLSRGQMLPWPTPQPVPYQIIRRPRKSAAGSLQLPARTVIDLEASGIDSAPMLFQSTGTLLPITIMFSPNGTVDRVYVDTTIRRVAEPVFLLVGKLERVRERQPDGTFVVPAEDDRANWEDTTNYWVTLNPQTGLITTTELAQGANLAESRQIAREGQSMGGR